MAKEKLSSRQKMIGVMYLVLTAMLALQVSSSVLDRFVLLSVSIDKSSKLQMAHNEHAIQALKSRVQDMGSRSADVKVLEGLVSIHRDTLALTSYIETLKKELIHAEGGLDHSTKLPKGMKNDGAVARLMINKGEGAALKAKLDTYIASISNLAQKRYPIIAYDANDHSFFSHNPNQAGKDFVTLHFDHTPLGTALATLSQFASEVITTEGDAINRLGSVIGASDIRFDSLKLLANTKSSVVVAGGKYEADLILAASSAAVLPEMFIDGKPIPTEYGVGKISFTTLPGPYDSDGFSRKSFQASIKLKEAGGKDSTITETIEYVVAKPVIQVKSATVQSLYRNCGNALDIQVPALGVAYAPRFKVEGGESVAGPKKGMVTVIPKRSTVKLSVYNGAHLIGTETFMVQDIPTPAIIITSNNRPIDLKGGVPIPGPRTLEAQVVPNKYFHDFLPKDARYSMLEWDITLARGSRPIHKLEVKSGIADLRPLAAMAKPGDRLVIEIKTIARQNFKDERENIRHSAIFNIPLN